MPRPRIDPWYDAQVKHFLGAGFSDNGVADRVLEAARAEGRRDHPDERTLRGRAATYRPEMGEIEVLPRFRWPNSMEDEDLPWEAPRAMLDLLRLCDVWAYPRPTVAFAHWYWMVFQAAPDLPPSLIHAIATEYMGGGLDFLPTSELFLAYAPWRTSNLEARKMLLESLKQRHLGVSGETLDGYDNMYDEGEEYEQAWRRGEVPPHGEMTAFHARPIARRRRGPRSRAVRGTAEGASGGPIGGSESGGGEPGPEKGVS